MEKFKPCFWGVHRMAVRHCDYTPAITNTDTYERAHGSASLCILSAIPKLYQLPTLRTQTNSYPHILESRRS